MKRAVTDFMDDGDEDFYVPSKPKRKKAKQSVDNDITDLSSSNDSPGGPALRDAMALPSNLATKSDNNTSATKNVRVFNDI